VIAIATTVRATIFSFAAIGIGARPSATKLDGGSTAALLCGVAAVENCRNKRVHEK
jgi:hypothetical protein